MIILYVASIQLLDMNDLPLGSGKIARRMGCPPNYADLSIDERTTPIWDAWVRLRQAYFSNTANIYFLWKLRPKKYSPNQRRVNGGASHFPSTPNILVFFVLEALSRLTIWT